MKWLETLMVVSRFLALLSLLFFITVVIHWASIDWKFYTSYLSTNIVSKSYFGIIHILWQEHVLAKQPFPSCSRDLIYFRSPQLWFNDLGSLISAPWNRVFCCFFWIILYTLYNFSFKNLLQNRNLQKSNYPLGT